MASRNAEAEKFWREKVLPKNRELDAELQICKKEKRKTKHYENLLVDCRKLKEEYEKLAGGKPYDPHNLSDVESAADRTARHYLGGRDAQ